MTRDELSSLIREVNEDIVAMAKAQRLRDQVRDAIAYRAANPTEEQFIDEDSFGKARGQPTVLVVDGIQIQVWKLHRVGLQLRDVKGADLFYEIPKAKFVLIQYKTPSQRGRVTLDEDQLKELRDACPVDCLPTSRFKCGSWYAIRGLTAEAYFPACEAQQVFGSFNSRKVSAFINGLTKQQFQEDFGRCHIGARTGPIRVAEYRRFSLREDRIFVHARQSRAPGSRA